MLTQREISGIRMIRPSLPTCLSPWYLRQLESSPVMPPTLAAPAANPCLPPGASRLAGGRGREEKGGGQLPWQPRSRLPTHASVSVAWGGAMAETHHQPRGPQRHSSPLSPYSCCPTASPEYICPPRLRGPSPRRSRAAEHLNFVLVFCGTKGPSPLDSRIYQTGMGERPELDYGDEVLQKTSGEGGASAPSPPHPQ